ncbi:hypothetical protein NDU88_007051 [Pleurodeles waltl]|uniref:Uncharacterized protein n=1 Tax=Pleurodeles waltl TaxID=8319 RepID=A0AAV7M1U7_PLEWA|nr:hypothetical protein NDU88_007051 [Pleurodeles waltl]
MTGRGTSLLRQWPSPSRTQASGRPPVPRFCAHRHWSTRQQSEGCRIGATSAEDSVDVSTSSYRAGLRLIQATRRGPYIPSHKSPPPARTSFHAGHHRPQVPQSVFVVPMDQKTVRGCYVPRRFHFSVGETG